MYIVKKIVEVNSKYHRKRHVYRKSKTIGNISFNRCKSKACSHIYHSLQKKANTNEKISKHNWLPFINKFLWPDVKIWYVKKIYSRRWKHKWENSCKFSVVMLGILQEKVRLKIGFKYFNRGWLPNM